jgi:hypothetical protein
MHPDKYLTHAAVPVMLMPDIHPMLSAAGYEPYDIGVMGELDVKILTELFGGPEIADGLAPEWNGGLYFAAQRKSAVTAAQKESPGSIALLYSSRWKNPDSARSFVRVYSGQLARKYKHVTQRAKDQADDSEQVYSTEEGDVLISISGSGVFVSEGFELALARKLRDSISSLQSDAPLRLATSGTSMGDELGGHELGGHELTMEMVRGLSSMGVMKAAIPRRYTSIGNDR